MSSEAEPVPDRCETDGCHRETDYRLGYEVYAGGRHQFRTRAVCEPCVNAMQFRQQFPSSEDAWRLEEVAVA